MKQLNFALIIILAIITIPSFSQNEAEVRSDGIIVPKINNAQRPSPAVLGHLVYNTSQNQFEYYNGANWVPLISGIANSNEIENSAGNSFVRVEENGVDDYIKVALNGNVKYNLFTNSNQLAQLHFVNSQDNVLIGNDAGESLNNLAVSNIALGKSALPQAITVDRNIAIGESTLSNISINQNTTVFGSNNTAVGYEAFSESDATLAYGTAIGYRAGHKGSGGVYVGRDAGFDGGSGIFIGNQAGTSTSLSKNNALFINNGSGTPLIYGQFANKYLNVNGTLEVSRNAVGSSQTVVAALESDSRRPVLLFTPGGTTLTSGMSIEYDARSTNLESRMHINDRDGSSIMTVTNGTATEEAKLGIGTDDPDATLHVVGDAKITGLPSGGMANDVHITAAGVLVKSTSDARLKENIQTIDNALQKVLNMRGVSFDWIGEPNETKTLGVIAQEVMEVVPEIVTKNDDYFGVNYSEIPALLIEAIKEQQKLIESMKRDIEKLSATDN